MRHGQPLHGGHQKTTGGSIAVGDRSLPWSTAGCYRLTDFTFECGLWTRNRQPTMSKSNGQFSTGMRKDIVRHYR
jgi:hypothetical protein